MAERNEVEITIEQKLRLYGLLEAAPPAASQGDIRALRELGAALMLTDRDKAMINYSEADGKAFFTAHKASEYSTTIEIGQAAKMALSQIVLWHLRSNLNLRFSEIQFLYQGELAAFLQIPIS